MTKNNLELANDLGTTVGKVSDKMYRDGLKRPRGLGQKLARTEEVVKKFSKTTKQNYRTGKRVAWNKGKPRRKEVRDKISKSQLGVTLEMRHGKEKAEEIKKRLRDGKKGEKWWAYGKRGPLCHNYGRKLSEEHKTSISNAHKGKVFGYKFPKGEEHPFWNNGSSFEPYDIRWTKRFRNLIRKRDNQICMLCGIHREKLSNALNVHHINYDKKMSVPPNCVTLCPRCHTVTNFNRTQWVIFFQSLLSKRYGYKYNSDQKILIDFFDEKIKK